MAGLCKLHSRTCPQNRVFLYSLLARHGFVLPPTLRLELQNTLLGMAAEGRPPPGAQSRGLCAFKTWAGEIYKRPDWNDVPPGLEPVSSIKVVATGGDSRWLPYAGKAIFSNVVPVDEREGKILLAFRIDGFGRNKYNPFSGPIQPGSNPLKAATRDLQGQCGLQAVDISKLGKLIVVLEGNAIALDVDVFRTTSWRGDVADTLEVRPRWFSAPTAISSGSQKLPAVPWDQMFEDNKFWIPLLTEGKYFIGRIDFGAPSPGEDVGPLLRYWFATV